MKVKKGPWTKLGSKIVYQTKWVKVEEDQVIRPDGDEGIHSVITLKQGVTVLPMDEDGNVYLTQEYHYAIESDSLEAMSGGMDNNETPEEAVKRELKEEMGIVAKRLVNLGRVDPFTTVVTAPDYMFLALDLFETNRSPEGTEVIKIVKMPFKQAFKYAMESKITHSASVALILKTNEYLKSNFPS